MRGAFTFPQGRWVHLAVTVRLNDPGVHNGVIKVDVDGQSRIYYSKVLYRWVGWVGGWAGGWRWEAGGGVTKALIQVGVGTTPHPKSPQRPVHPALPRPPTHPPPTPRVPLRAGAPPTPNWRPTPSSSPPGTAAATPAGAPISRSRPSGATSRSTSSDHELMSWRSGFRVGGWDTLGGPLMGAQGSVESSKPGIQRLSKLVQQPWHALARPWHAIRQACTSLRCRVGPLASGRQLRPPSQRWAGRQRDWPRRREWGGFERQLEGIAEGQLQRAGRWGGGTTALAVVAATQQLACTLH